MHSGAEHVHGGGEQDTLICLAGAPADDFGQEGLPGARPSNYIMQIIS
jgi:hypothetical protein